MHSGGQSVDPLDQRPGRAVENIDLILTVSIGPAHPPPSRDQCAVGTHCNGINIAKIGESGGQADRALRPAAGERPHPHRLVERPGDRPTSVAISRRAADRSRMRSRIDHEDRPIVKLRRVLRVFGDNGHGNEIRRRARWTRTTATTLPPTGFGSPCASARRRPCCASRSP